MGLHLTPSVASHLGDSNKFPPELMGLIYLHTKAKGGEIFCLRLISVRDLT